TAHAFPSGLCRRDSDSRARRGTWAALPTHSGATVPASALARAPDRLPRPPGPDLTDSLAASFPPHRLAVLGQATWTTGRPLLGLTSTTTAQPKTDSSTSRCSTAPGG